jgi:hypothetical protein
MRYTYYSGFMMMIVGVVVGVGLIAIGQGATGAILLLSLTLSGAFMAWLAHGWDTPLESTEELHRYGRPANATVLEVSDEQLRPDGTRVAKLKLHVAPRNESSYKTTRLCVLPKGRVPTIGERVTVKFDPQARKNVVLLEESYDVEDHLTVAARQMHQMMG